MHKQSALQCSVKKKHPREMTFAHIFLRFTETAFNNDAGIMISSFHSPQLLDLGLQPTGVTK